MRTIIISYNLLNLQFRFASTAYDSSTFEELVPMAPDIGAHLEIIGKTLVSKYRSTSKDIQRTQNIRTWI
jgi:hypothetical protein